MIIYKTPPKLTVQYAQNFISHITPIFNMCGKQVKEVHFDAKKTIKTDILGQLLLYKFFDFSVRKKCFFNPTTNLYDNKNLIKELEKIGFKKIIRYYFKNNDFKNPIEPENDVSFVDEGEFFLAPIILDKKEIGVGKKNEEKIKKYFSYNDLIKFCVLQCIGEISSNFQEHSVSDTKSVLVAKGNKTYIEIACADNGEGIITTLHKYVKEINFNVLKSAIQKNVTSKKDQNHMGCGLWFINELATKLGGILFIFSQRGYLKNNAGNIKCGESPYWKGTIIYLYLPLKNSAEIASFLEDINNENDDIEVNNYE